MLLFYTGSPQLAFQELHYSQPFLTLTHQVDLQKALSWEGSHVRVTLTSIPHGCVYGVCGGSSLH